MRSSDTDPAEFNTTIPVSGLDSTVNLRAIVKASNKTTVTYLRLSLSRFFTSNALRVACIRCSPPRFPCFVSLVPLTLTRT
jgi:hypothetical protein